jgi:hypothetical protein
MHIDIALDINIQRDDFRRKKSSFIASLIRMGFDMKIDLEIKRTPII